MKFYFYFLLVKYHIHKKLIDEATYEGHNSTICIVCIGETVNVMYTSCGETVTVVYPSSKYVYVYVCIYVCICEVCIYICDGNNKKNI